LNMGFWGLGWGSSSREDRGRERKRGGLFLGGFKKIFIFKLLYGPVCPLTHPDMDIISTNCPHINKL
jgi:hypothetical protein